MAKLTPQEELELLQLEEEEYQASLSATQQPPEEQNTNAPTSSPGMTLTPDKAMGAVETTVRTAANQALMGQGERASALVERGLAKLDPTLSSAAYQDIYGSKSIKEQTQENKEALTAGQDTNPFAAFVGTLGGEVASLALGEGATRVAFKVLSPVVAASTKLAAKPIEAATEAMGTLANRLSVSGIKLSPKWASKAEQIGKLLRDYGITNTPRTLAKTKTMLDDTLSTVGKELDATWKAASKKGTQAMNLDDLAVNVKANWQASVPKGTVVPESDLAKIAGELADVKDVFKNPNAITMDEIWKAARSLESGSGKYDRVRATVLDKITDALRKTAVQEAAIFAPKHVAEKLVSLSTDYSLLKVASRGIRAKQNLVEQALGLSKRAATATVGGYVGGKLGGKEGAAVGTVLGLGLGTNVAKTTAVGAAGLAEKAGAKLLSLGPALGKFGKLLAQTAAKNGFGAVLSRHAHLYMGNKKYRDAVDAAGGFTFDEEGSNGSGQ